MAGLNQVTILGNLGQDPELRHTQSQEAVCTMSVATSEAWTDKATGEKKEETEWHRVVVWGKQAENCAKYLQKGAKVCVTGKLKTRSWEDKDGVKRYTTEIVAAPFGVHFTSSAGGGSARPPAPGDESKPAYTGPANGGGQEAGSPGLDQIPF